MEPKVIEYPIPGNDKGGILHVFGEKTEKSSQECILYVGGFPDGVEPFAPMAKRLASDGCFVGVTCFPGYDFGRYSEPGSNYLRDGYRFDEVVLAVREAASQLFGEYNKTGDEQQSKCKTPGYTLVLHDFGTVVGAMYANQVIADKELSISKRDHAPDRIVFLDVLLGPARNMMDCTKHLPPHTKREMRSYIAYRGTHAWSFLLHRLSKPIGVMAYGILGGFVMLSGLSPTRDIDNRMVSARIDSFDRLSHMIYMMYPYFYMFKALMFNKKALAGAHLPANLEKTPVLFLYGADKNVTFNDRRGMAVLEKHPECRVVKVHDAGHWLYCQQPDVVEQEITSFICKGGESGTSFATAKKSKL